MYWGREASIESNSTCPEGDNQDQAQMRALRKVTCFEGPMAQSEIWREGPRKILNTTTKKGVECEEGEWTNVSLMVGIRHNVERKPSGVGEGQLPTCNP